MPNKKYCYSLLLLLIPLLVSAQDFRKDMGLMTEYYMHAESYASDISIQAYSGDNHVIYNQKAVLRKSGERYYYQLGSIEMIVNSDAVMMVKSDDRTLLYKPRILSREFNLFANTPMQQLDSAFAQYDSVRYFGNQEGQKLYRVYTHKGPVMEADIYLDAGNSSIKKIMSLYNPAIAGKGYKTVVAFKQAAGSISEQTYQTATYIKKQGSKLVPATKYSQYTLTVVPEE